MGKNNYNTLPKKGLPFIH